METKNREKMLAIGFIVCIGLYVLDLVVINPLTASWTSRQDKIAQLRKDLSNGKMEVRRAAATDNNWERMRTNALSHNETVAEDQLFRSFDGWARTSAVTLVSQKPERKDSDDPDYANMEWRAEVTGTLPQIFNFLYSVEGSPVGLKVDSVELTSRDDTTGRGQPGGPQLALGLTVSGLILNISTNNAQ